MNMLSNETQRYNKEEKEIEKEIQSKSEEYQKLAEEIQAKQEEYEKLARAFLELNGLSDDSPELGEITKK